jgi:hypothetical protein
LSQKSRNQLKSIFVQGSIPSQQDFYDFIDSSWNITDDGSISGATGPAGATGATGPFLGGDFGELYSNGTTGSFSESIFSGSNWVWNTGVAGESNATTVTPGDGSTTPASFTISNTGTYSISISANLVTTFTNPASISDPIYIYVLLNGSTNPKLVFPLTYQSASWNGYYNFSNGDNIRLRITNSTSSDCLVQSGSLYFNILQIK